MDESMLYVLDTHVLIWYFIGSKRLQQELKEQIDETRHHGTGVLTKDRIIRDSGEVEVP